jgi:sulfite reductase (NADPH) hemoprotein beta-component
VYKYDDYDRELVKARVDQFRDQVKRRLNGELTEEEFLPLRLQNGVYLQRHAYMLRVAIPYGTLSSKQLRALATVAERYDRGYGHLTTRQNIQFNWVELERVPDILEWLASHEMHAIQTSGNCVRNISTDAFAGVARDEVMDPRPLAEILRQWSTINPEFLFLPRKFKIAIASAEQDRAATKAHDIGLHLYLDAQGSQRLRVIVGGGLGRTPILGQVVREDLCWKDLLSYVEAVLRVYNRHGRRDNKYKARIKILVRSLGLEAFRDEVDREWEKVRHSSAQLTEKEYQRVAGAFSAPYYERLDALDPDMGAWLARDKDFARWLENNTRPHQVAGYMCVVLSTKSGGTTAPGDITAEQMRAAAGLAETFGFGELRVAHEQNLVLPDIRKKDLYRLWKALTEQNLATPNIGLLTDIIACPGGDYCSLANTRSIPLASALQERFNDLDYLHDLGDLSLNISGCMNACGHHHIGNIGILGVDRNGEEYFQVTIGGSKGNSSALGKIIGPSFRSEEVVGVVERLLTTYLDYREVDEPFNEAVQRLGIAPFKESVYGTSAKKPEARS